MRLKILAGIAFVLALFAFNAYYPLQDVLLDLVTLFQKLGSFSVVLFLLLYAACSAFFIPVSPLMMMAGILYGFWRGYLLTAVSGLTGVALTYWLGKKFWRKRVEQLRVENPRFESIYGAISKKGPLLVFLIRLNPFLPFTLLNYLFTIPKLDFRMYMLCSLLGMTPDIFFYLYAGKVGRGLLDGSSGFTVWNGVILGLAIAATTVAAVIINGVIRGSAPAKPAPLETKVPAGA